MFRKRVAVALGFAVLFAVAGNASAADPKETGPYVVLSSNYALNYEGSVESDFPDLGIEESVRADSIHGLSLSARLGYDLNKYFAAELESGWSVFDFKTSDVLAEATGISDGGNLHVVPLLVNAVAKYPVEQFVPYVTGGTGVFFVGFGESSEVKDAEIDVDVGSAAYGFKLGGGLDYFLTENLALNLESGFWFIVDPEFTVLDAEDGSTLSSGEADMDTWYIGGGLKFKF